MASLADRGRSLAGFFHREIWEPEHLKPSTLRSRAYAVFRVIAITGTVFSETKAASRAAALSFSSLLGLGPLIGAAVLLGGFMLGQHSDPAVLADQFSRVIKSVAPPLQQLETIDGPTTAAAADAEHETALAEMVQHADFFRDAQRVIVRQYVNQRSQLDFMRALDRGAKKHAR